MKQVEKETEDSVSVLYEHIKCAKKSKFINDFTLFSVSVSSDQVSDMQFFGGVGRF